MPSDTDHHDHTRPHSDLRPRAGWPLSSSRPSAPGTPSWPSTAMMPKLPDRHAVVDDLGRRVDPDAVSSRIVDRAEHEGRMPTGEQSREIYGLVETVCR